MLINSSYWEDHADGGDAVPLGRREGNAGTVEDGRVLVAEGEGGVAAGHVLQESDQRLQTYQRHHHKAQARTRTRLEQSSQRRQDVSEEQAIVHCRRREERGRTWFHCRLWSAEIRDGTTHKRCNNQEKKNLRLREVGSPLRVRDGDVTRNHVEQLDNVPGLLLDRSILDVACRSEYPPHTSYRKYTRSTAETERERESQRKTVPV